VLIQIHTLQNYAPANLNRDDSGSPKDAMFGGFLRGRISSQCLKRSIRRGETSPFRVEFEKDGLLGERTKQLPAIIREALAALHADEKAIDAIVVRAGELGRESRKTKNRDEEDGGEDAENTASDTDVADVATEAVVDGGTKQLIFIDRKTEAPRMAEILLALYRKDAKAWAKLKPEEIAKALGASVPRSVDIALFGRMTTSAALKNIQASVQVAHALSTNAIKQEFDYYTAMDDLQADSEPGAGMIGDVEFNSACYYKYCNAHWEGLLSNVGGDIEIAQRAILALLEGFIFAQPSGKQNSFAAHNLPDFVLVEVSDKNLPVNYANAFLKPVKGFGDRTLMENSVSALSNHVGRLSKVFSLTPNRAYLSVDGYGFMDLEPEPTLDGLKTWIRKQLPTK